MGKSLFDIAEILSIDGEQAFNDLACDIFYFQRKNNAVYRNYLKLIGKSNQAIDRYQDIPFLPITFFKNFEVKSFTENAEKIFKSSSTTGVGRSSHHVKSLSEYYHTSLCVFEKHFGPTGDFEFIGLLPNYLEQGDSSLVAMVHDFMKKSGQGEPLFFLNNFNELHSRLVSGTSKTRILFGVSYALLDYALSYPGEYQNLIVIETGGMKGRKKEITKFELYEALQAGFINCSIFSEYGMTELMSQAYSNNGIYACPPWMRVAPRVDSDPLSKEAFKKRGALNIIDLANINSCSFIATDDLAIVHNPSQFEILGRLDTSDIRGCSQMASD